MKRLKRTSPKAYSVILIIISLLFLSCAKTIRANERILFEDNFDRGLEKWEAVRGNLSDWIANNGQIGSIVSQYDTSVEITPKDEFWNEEWGNYIFEVDIIPKRGVDRNLTFRFQGIDKWYELHHTIDKHGWYGISLDRVYPDQNKQLIFVKASDGYFPGENRSLVDSIFHFKIVINGNQIIAYLREEKEGENEKLIFNYTDDNTPLTKGKIGLKVSSGSVNPTEVWFDNVKITKIGEDTFPTPRVEKVILAPGMGASWNTEAILNCKLNGYQGDWTMAPFAEDIYNPLISSLQDNGFQVIPFYYDWRKRIPSHSTNISNLITNLNLGENEKVDFVGHSMGGLVGRDYLKSGSDKIYKYISAGSPHQGTALAYPAWYGGEIWNNSLVTKIAATLLIKRCGVNRKNDMETLREIAPSFQDLLPTYPFLRDTKTGILKSINTNQWLKENTFPPTGTDTIIATLSGKGFDTLENIRTKEPSKKEKKLGLWEEGKPAGKETTTKGDGTVLSKSAKIENEKVTNFEINQNHGGLVTSQEGINTIINFLKGEKSALSATSLITGEEPKSALVMIAYPSTFVSIDPQGKIKKDKHNVVAQINPKSGKYKVGFLPLADESTLLIGQFLKNGDYSWKEYKIKGRLPFAKTIKFDENTLTENPLQ